MRSSQRWRDTRSRICSSQTAISDVCFGRPRRAQPRKNSRLIPLQRAGGSHNIYCKYIFTGIGMLTPGHQAAADGASAGLSFTLVALLRADWHLCNVLTHVSSGDWRAVEQAINAILEPRTPPRRLSNIARNMLELLCDDRGVTGRRMRPFFFEAMARVAGRAEMKRLEAKIRRFGAGCPSMRGHVRRFRPHARRPAAIARRDTPAPIRSLSSRRRSGLSTESSYDLRRHRELHQVQVYGLRRGLPGRLLLRRREYARHPSRRMHRLWCVRTGMPCRGDQAPNCGSPASVNGPKLSREYALKWPARTSPRKGFRHADAKEWDGVPEQKLARFQRRTRMKSNRQSILAEPRSSKHRSEKAAHDDKRRSAARSERPRARCGGDRAAFGRAKQPASSSGENHWLKLNMSDAIRKTVQDLKRRARFEETKVCCGSGSEVAEGLDRALVARPLKPLSSEGLPQDYVDINGAERWVLDPKNFAWQSLTREANHG